MFIQNLKNIACIVSIFGILGMIIFPMGPSYAVYVDLDGLSTFYMQGDITEYDVAIGIFSEEQIPITRISLTASGATSAEVVWLPDGTIIQASSVFPNIEVINAPTNYGYGYFYAIQYGYFGYGYGYAGPQAITYRITMDTSFLNIGSHDLGVSVFTQDSQEPIFYSPLYTFTVSSSLVQVSIDIKPDSFPNTINYHSKGKIPVAILSTIDFDARNLLDISSLTFGRTGDEESLHHCNPNPVDVNGDGLSDILCHFYTEIAGFKPRDTEGILKGKTINGIDIEGKDSVRIVGPKE